MTAIVETTGRTTFALGRGVIDCTGAGLRAGEGVLIRDGKIVHCRDTGERRAE